MISGTESYSMGFRVPWASCGLQHHTFSKRLDSRVILGDDLSSKTYRFGLQVDSLDIEGFSIPNLDQWHSVYGWEVEVSVEQRYQTG